MFPGGFQLPRSTSGHLSANRIRHEISQVRHDSMNERRHKDLVTMQSDSVENFSRDVVCAHSRRLSFVHLCNGTRRKLRDTEYRYSNDNTCISLIYEQTLPRPVYRRKHRRKPGGHLSPPKTELGGQAYSFASPIFSVVFAWLAGVSTFKPHIFTYCKYFCSSDAYLKVRHSFT
jgi:hypothetical protein